MNGVRLGNLEFHADLGQADRVAERDKIGSALRTLNRRNTRDSQYIALLGVTLLDQF